MSRREAMRILSVKGPFSFQSAFRKRCLKVEQEIESGFVS